MGLILLGLWSLEILEDGITHRGIVGFSFYSFNGGLAQLARAPALHAGGHRFDSDILHDSIDLGYKAKHLLSNI